LNDTGSIGTISQVATNEIVSPVHRGGEPPTGSQIEGGDTTDSSELVVLQISAISGSPQALTPSAAAQPLLSADE
jgi:hypothetical protein